MKLFTYGYGSIPIENAIEYLKGHGVSHVVDVRYSPNSRNPSYRRAALEAALKGSGLLYTHLPELGNVNYKLTLPSGAIRLSDADGGFRKLHPLVAQAWATGGAVCILCVCKRPDGCHRRLVSDTFQSVYDGITVHDL